MSVGCVGCFLGVVGGLDSLWFTLVCPFRLPGSVDTFYGRVGFLLVDGGLMIIMQPKC